MFELDIDMLKEQGIQLFDTAKDVYKRQGRCKHRLLHSRVKEE